MARQLSGEFCAVPWKPAMLKYSLVIIGVVSIVAVVGIPLGGFVLGMVKATGNGGLFSTIMVGLIYAVLTVFTLGFPPKDESGAPNDSYDAWPYIGGVDLALLTLLLALWMLSMRQSRRKS